MNYAYFYSVYLWCILPLIVVLFIFLIGFIRIKLLNNKKEKETTTTKQEKKMKDEILNQHSWYIFLWLYVVLPPLCFKQLSAFDCMKYKSSEVLRLNTSVDCESESYLFFRYVVFGCFLFYQIIIPLTIYLLLRHRRMKLNPTHIVAKSQHLKLYLRKKEYKDLKWLDFLYVHYKCNKWWFEIVEFYRRMLFIGLLPLLSHKDNIRTSLGLLLSFASLLWYKEQKPFLNHFTNRFASYAQVIHPYIYIRPPFSLPLSLSLMVGFQSKYLFPMCFKLLIAYFLLLLLLFSFFFICLDSAYGNVLLGIVAIFATWKGFSGPILPHRIQARNCFSCIECNDSYLFGVVRGCDN
jgi:hypothetical protein